MDRREHPHAVDLGPEPVNGLGVPGLREPRPLPSLLQEKAVGALEPGLKLPRHAARGTAGSLLPVDRVVALLVRGFEDVEDRLFVDLARLGSDRPCEAVKPGAAAKAVVLRELADPGPERPRLVREIGKDGARAHGRELVLVPQKENPGPRGVERVKEP